MGFESMNTNQGNQSELSTEKTKSAFKSLQDHVNQAIEQDHNHQCIKETHLNTIVDNQRESENFEGMGNSTKVQSSFLLNVFPSVSVLPSL